MRPSLAIVIPCYNEQSVLPITAPKFLAKLNALIESGQISNQSKIVFVNDGSKDDTWSIIKHLSSQNPQIAGICLSRNKGHQNALLAGLMSVKDKFDLTISIDCDGQDDIDAMDEMIARYHEGCEIVYGVRKSRASDTWFKRTTAQGFYKLLQICGAEVIYNHADYRLVSARALREFAKFDEVNLFLRGMFPMVGFQSAIVEYDRSERIAGESHYPLGKMISLAINGITNLSVKPIRMIAIFGLLVSLLSAIGCLWAVISYFSSHTVSGWASLICVICFFGGVQLLSLGIIGEYIGKVYLETKRRPKFIVAETENL